MAATLRRQPAAAARVRAPRSRGAARFCCCCSPSSQAEEHHARPSSMTLLLAMMLLSASRASQGRRKDDAPDKRRASREALARGANRSRPTVYTSGHTGGGGGAPRRCAAGASALAAGVIVGSSSSTKAAAKHTICAAAIVLVRAATLFSQSAAELSWARMRERAQRGARELSIRMARGEGEGRGGVLGVLLLMGMWQEQESGALPEPALPRGRRSPTGLRTAPRCRCPRLHRDSASAANVCPQ